MEHQAPSVRPPIALGCTFAIAGAGLIIALAIFFLAFLNSGANSGTVVLEKPEVYPPGTVQYQAADNFYLVRLQDGKFLALSDLDAANRASPRRCRVHPLTNADPVRAELVAKYAGRMSPQAAGSTYLLREDCNLAVYDFTGQRLDAEGPNLDRLAVSTNKQGKLTIDVTNRSCTEREGAQNFAAITCP